LVAAEVEPNIRSNPGERRVDCSKEATAFVLKRLIAVEEAKIAAPAKKAVSTPGAPVCAMFRANRTAFTRRTLNSDPATMRKHHVAAVSAGSDRHPHVQPFAIRNEPLHFFAGRAFDRGVACRLATNDPGARGAGLAALGLHSLQKNSLRNRRSVCLAVTYGQIYRWCFTLQRTAEGHLSALFSLLD
jgi:hypothetical protein